MQNGNVENRKVKEKQNKGYYMRTKNREQYLQKIRNNNRKNKVGKKIQRNG